MSISLKQLLDEGVNYSPPLVDVTKATRGGANPTTKAAARRLFYDFYAMSNLHYQFGRPNLSTAAKVKASMNMPDFGAGMAAGANWPEVEFPTTGVILPHKAVENVEKVYEQVTHAIAAKLIEYLKMATLQELRHIINHSNGWSAFRHDLVSILNSKGTISHDDFKKSVKEHIPDMSNDLPSVMRLLKFSKYYSKMKGSSGQDAFDSARKNVPIPGKPPYKADNEPEVASGPEPAEVPEPTSPESEFPDETDYSQEPIDDPFADEPTGGSPSSKDPSYSEEDYYWDPELKQQIKAKGHKVKPPTDDKQKLEEDYASGKISPSTIAKIQSAAEKAGLTLQDIDNAYNKVPWGGGYGGPKWGTGTQALIKLENDKYEKMSVETLAQHVDHIFDLVHNGGPILNKGGFYMDEVDLDRRAKATDVARFLPHVSPLIQRLITMVLRHLYKNPEEQKNIDVLLNSPLKPFTPEEDTAISDATGGNAYPEGDARKVNIRFFSKKKDDYGNPIEVQGRYYEIKVHTNGKYTIADDLRADIQVFDKFEDVIKYIAFFKNDIKGGGSSGYTAPTPAAPSALQMYITTHERIKLPVDKEQLLYQIKMGWRTKSKYYKAYYPGDKRFLLYAFGDGTFLAHYTNNAPAYKTFNDWATMFDYCKEQTATADDTHQAEALANIGGTFSGKTVAPASTPSVAPPAPPKPTTPFTLSPVEQQALAQFISNTYPASSSEKYNVGPLNNGMVVVQKVKNNNPVDCFRVGQKVGIAYGKKYTLEHHLGGGSPAEKWGFNDWTSTFTFIKANIEKLTVGAPLANQATTPGTTSTPGFYTPKNLPSHSTSKASYTVHSGITSPPKSTIRLTKEDEAIVQAAGFEPKMMGDDVWYVHKTNGDSVKFFPNDTAKLIFTNKSTFSGAPILKFTIDKMLKWLPMNYNASTTASPIQTGAAPMPANPSAAASTPVAAPSSIGAPKPTGKGIQLGSIYEKQFISAGFQWDPATDRYVDGDNSLVINKDRSSILTIGQDAPQHFKNLPDLVNHLVDEYPAQKKSKPIKNSSTEKLKQLLAKGGFKKIGVPPVSNGKGIKYANDKKDVIVVYATKASDTYDATYHLSKHFDTIEQLNDYLENELLATSLDVGGLETGEPTAEHKNGITPAENTRIATVVNDAGEQYWTEYVKAAPDQTAYVEIFKKNSSKEPANIVLSVGALGNYYQINDANNKPLKTYQALDLLLFDLKYLLEHNGAGASQVLPDSSKGVTQAESKGIQDIASKHGYISSWNSGQGQTEDYVYIYKKPKDETVPAKYPLAYGISKNESSHYVINGPTGNKLKAYTGYAEMLSDLDLTLSGAEDSPLTDSFTSQQVEYVGNVVESYPGWKIHSNNIYIAINSPKKGTEYVIAKQAGTYSFAKHVPSTLIHTSTDFESIITAVKEQLNKETGGQGGQPTPTFDGPTPTPSAFPNSISESEFAAIKGAAIAENVEVDSYNHGLNSGAFLYVYVGERPYYIIRKRNGEYEILYSVKKGSALSEPPYGEPYLTHMWTKVLPEYSLIKNPHVTDFEEFMGYIKEIFHNIGDNNKVLGEPGAAPAADPNKFSAGEVEKLDELVKEPHMASWKLGWWYGRFTAGKGLLSGKPYLSLVQLDNKKKKYLYLFKVDGKYEAFKLDNTIDKLISTENFPTLTTVVGSFIDMTFGKPPKEELPAKQEAENLLKKYNYQGNDAPEMMVTSWNNQSDDTINIAADGSVIIYPGNASETYDPAPIHLDDCEQLVGYLNMKHGGHGAYVSEKLITELYKVGFELDTDLTTGNKTVYSRSNGDMFFAFSNPPGVYQIDIAAMNIADKKTFIYADAVDAYYFIAEHYKSGAKNTNWSVANGKTGDGELDEMMMTMGFFYKGSMVGDPLAMVFTKPDGTKLTIYDDKSATYNWSNSFIGQAATGLKDFDTIKQFLVQTHLQDKEAPKKPQVSTTELKGPSMYFQHGDTAAMATHAGFTKTHNEPDGVVYQHENNGFLLRYFVNGVSWSTVTGAKEVVIEGEELNKYLVKVFSQITEETLPDEMDIIFSKEHATRREKLFDRLLRKAKQLNGVFMGDTKFGEMLENNEFSWNEFDKCYMNEELKQIVVVTPEFGKNKFHLFWITSEGTEGHSNPNQTELFPLIGPNGNLNIDKEGYEKSKITPSGVTYATQTNAANAQLIKLNAHDEALLAKCGFGWTPTENHYYKNAKGDVIKFLDTGKAEYSEAETSETIDDFKNIPHALKFIVVKYLDPSKGLNSIPPPPPDVIKISPFSDENYNTHPNDDALDNIQLNDHDASLLGQIGFEWKKGKGAYVKLVNSDETPALEEAKKKKKPKHNAQQFELPLNDPPKPEPDLTLKSDDDEPDVPDNSDDDMPPDYDPDNGDDGDADIYEVIYAYNSGNASWTETHEPFEAMGGDDLDKKDGTIKEILDFVWNRWSDHLPLGYGQPDATTEALHKLGFAYVKGQLSGEGYEYVKHAKTTDATLTHQVQIYPDDVFIYTLFEKGSGDIVSKKMDTWKSTIAAGLEAVKAVGEVKGSSASHHKVKLSDYDYNTISQDGIHKVVSLHPVDAHELFSIGFEFKDVGYPLYVRGEDENFAAYNDNTAHYVDSSMHIDQMFDSVKEGVLVLLVQHKDKAPSPAPEKSHGITTKIISELYKLGFKWDKKKHQYSKEGSPDHVKIEGDYLVYYFYKKDGGIQAFNSTNPNAVINKIKAEEYNNSFFKIEKLGFVQQKRVKHAPKSEKVVHEYIKALTQETLHLYGDGKVRYGAIDKSHGGYIPYQTFPSMKEAAAYLDKAQKGFEPIIQLGDIAKGHPFPNHVDFGKVISAGFKWDENTGTYTRGYEKLAVYPGHIQYWANFKDDPDNFYTGKNLDQLVNTVNHHTDANILLGVSPTSKKAKTSDAPESKRVKADSATEAKLYELGFGWVAGVNLYSKGGETVIFTEDGKIYYNTSLTKPTQEFTTPAALLLHLPSAAPKMKKIATSNFNYIEWAAKVISNGEYKSDQTIQLVPEDNAAMEMMGFKLEYTGANKEPKYSNIYVDKTGKMVTFKVGGMAEYSDNGSNVTKFTNPKSMIEWMWNNYETLIGKKDNGVVVPTSANAAKGNPVDLLAVMDKFNKMVEEIKKLGFKPLNQQDQYYTKYDKEWIHSVELDGGKGTLEYVKSTNDVTHSKIKEQWKMPFKEGMERLREKFGVPTKPVPTGTMPFSDFPYHDLWKTQNINQSTSVQLTQEDDQTMKSMGFDLTHTGVGGYFYQKGIEDVSFFADGTAKYWPNNSVAKTEKFPSVKSAMEFLWKKYAPFIEEKLNEKLDYKSMMSLTFE